MKMLTTITLSLGLILSACAEESGKKKNDGNQYVNGVRVCNSGELEGLNRIYSARTTADFKSACLSYFLNRNDLSSCAARATTTITTSTGTVYPGDEIKIDTVKLKEICDSVK